MTDDYLALEKETSHLARQLFSHDIKKCVSFTNRLLDICTRAQGKDFLLNMKFGTKSNVEVVVS